MATDQIKRFWERPDASSSPDDQPFMNGGLLVWLAHFRVQELLDELIEMVGEEMTINLFTHELTDHVLTIHGAEQRRGYLYVLLDQVRLLIKQLPPPESEA